MRPAALRGDPGTVRRTASNKRKNHDDLTHSLERRSPVGSRGPRLPGFTVDMLPSVDSSNTELMRRARTGDTDPRCWWPSSRRRPGPHGPPWASGVGDSLMFSLGLPLAPGLVRPVAGRGPGVAEACSPAAAPAASRASASNGPTTCGWKATASWPAS
jgi:hypothetical protein